MKVWNVLPTGTSLNSMVHGVGVGTTLVLVVVGVTVTVIGLGLDEAPCGVGVMLGKLTVDVEVAGAVVVGVRVAVGSIEVDVGVGVFVAVGVLHKLPAVRFTSVLAVSTERAIYPPNATTIFPTAALPRFALAIVIPGPLVHVFVAGS